MFVKVLFKKIKTNHNKIRTDETKGKALGLPEVGKQFVMTADPLEFGASFRMINTSEVVSIDELENGWRLHTETGSIYEIMKL